MCRKAVWAIWFHWNSLLTPKTRSTAAERPDLDPSLVRMLCARGSRVVPWNKSMKATSPSPLALSPVASHSHACVFGDRALVGPSPPLDVACALYCEPQEKNRQGI